MNTYHSLQRQLRMASWHGITATASYTFSKAIDNTSEAYSSGAGGNTLSFAQNPFDTSRAERAVGGYDSPHVFGLTFICDFFFYKNQKGFAGKILGRLATELHLSLYHRPSVHHGRKPV